MIHEPTFEISAKIGGNDYQFSISPEWDEIKQEQYFVAAYENDQAGKLRKESNYWFWELGSTKFNASVAHFIGKQIDLYYRKVLTA